MFPIEVQALGLDSNPLAGVILNKALGQKAMERGFKPPCGGNTAQLRCLSNEALGFKPPCGGNTESPVALLAFALLDSNPLAGVIRLSLGSK